LTRGQLDANLVAQNQFRNKVMKAAASKFRGVFAFVVTPTKNDGDAVDENRLRDAIDYQIARGVQGITVFGSTGGIGSFSETERQRVIELAARHIGGRVVFLPGTGSITTAEAVRLSQFAEGAGADGVLVVPINYWKPTDDELYGHYEAIAKAVKIPLGIYNNPGTTGADIKPALVAKIAKIDNVGFIKESSGDMSRISAIRQLTGYQISVLNGNDACTPEAIAAGVEGWFAGSANFMPDKCVELFRLGYEKKDIDAMREFFQPMFPLCDYMGVKGYIRVAHTACDLLGRPMGPPRRPLRMLEPADRAVLAGLLDKAGLLDGLSKRTAAE
jgi:4-hydroxy-tetrahydrodipicolinate synthase